MPVQRVLRSRTARTPLVALGALSVGLVCAAVLLVAGNLGKDEVFRGEFGAGMPARNGAKSSQDNANVSRVKRLAKGVISP